MSLDLPTSMSIAGFTATVAGGLLLLSWLHQRSDQPLAQWGLAFVMAAVAVALIAARRHIPDVWSIFVANAILSAAYGLMWKGVRTFEGRPTRAVYVLAGSLIWILACAIPAFYALPTARAALVMAIGVTYSLLAASEFWRGRRELLISRWPIIILLVAHALTLPLRIPLAPSLDGSSTVPVDLLAFVLFESVLFCMCAAYFLASMTKERVALRYRRTSLLDPLTAVPNRRAFLKQAARIIERSGVSRGSVALLLFDLDRFKNVNDQYGHAAGDDALIAFCRVATGQLRPTDLFARLGGEEFACLLPDTSRPDALAVAERVRAAFEGTTHAAGEVLFRLTVSVGMAVSDRSNIDLPSLIVTADRALYSAKQQGRNRVEPASASAPRPFAVSRVS